MSRTEQTHSATSRSWLQLAITSSALLIACTGDKPVPDAMRGNDASADAARDPDAAASDAGPAPEPTLDWQRTTLALEPDGRTRPHTLMFPLGARAFAVRSSLADTADRPSVCFQLEEVSLGSEQWVGRASTDDYGDYCRTCRERVAAGAGYGFHVLPSGPDDAPTLDAIELRVALRDCVTLTPLLAAEAGSGEVVLEHTAWRPPPPAAKLRLPVSIVLASEHAFAGDDALLRRALEALREIWLQAGIMIEVAAIVSIELAAGPLSYDAVDRSALIALTRAARAALAARDLARVWPVIVLGRCLQRNDVLSGGRSEPLATTPHIPGGFGLQSEPDLIVVAAERCEGLSPGPRFLDPQTLGATLAHELGHYLGLFHVSERDGRPDSLPDTDPGSSNLMQVTPDPSSLTLTDSQMRVARRHPVFASPSRLQQP